MCAYAVQESQGCKVKHARKAKRKGTTWNRSIAWSAFARFPPNERICRRPFWQHNRSLLHELRQSSKLHWLDGRILTSSPLARWALRWAQDAQAPCPAVGGAATGEGEAPGSVELTPVLPSPRDQPPVSIVYLHWGPWVLWSSPYLKFGVPVRFLVLL